MAVSSSTSSPTSRREGWLWLAAGAGALLLLWALGPILMPFVAGAGLAYLGNPVVDRLQRLRLSRTAAVIVVFTAITAATLLSLILLLPLLHRQVTSFMQNVPDYLRWVQDTALPALGVTLPEDVRLDIAGLRTLMADYWAQAGGLARTALEHVSRSTGALVTFAINVLMIPVVTFYLLRDWNGLVRWIEGIIPRGMLPTARSLAQETDDVLGAFLRGQLLVMTALGVFYSAGLWLAGLELALLIGLGAGLVSFVPYLGFFVGIVAAGVAMFVQTQEWLPLLWIALVFGLGQILETALLTPWLVGDRIGLHPVAVIFAILAGGHLFGFVGVLLALPAAAALAVLLRRAKQRWLQSPWYLGAP